jgi:fluoride exporter
MDRTILYVGIGGFAGSILRYLVALIFARFTQIPFPFATLAVNLLGCFAIGLVLGITERGGSVEHEMRALIVIGILGGFTTFSAFSYETLRLFQEGAFVFAGANILLNVMLGLGATYVGMTLTR